IGPADFVWQWPSTFLRSGAERLRELGRVSDLEVKMIVAELAEAERDSTTVMMTPLVLEIIATKHSNWSPNQVSAHVNAPDGNHAMECERRSGASPWRTAVEQRSILDERARRLLPEQNSSRRR